METVLTSAPHYASYTRPMIQWCENVAKGANIPVIQESLSEERLAEARIYDGVCGSIVLQPELDEISLAVAFAHELGHAFDKLLLHEPSTYEKWPYAAEAVAEYVSYIMADHFGVLQLVGESYFMERIEEQMKTVGRSYTDFLDNKAMIHRADVILARILPPEGLRRLRLLRSQQPGFEHSGKMGITKLFHFLRGT